MGSEIPIDRISNLPKNLKEAILVSLPIRDAVRTSILSHGWKYQWNTIPQLVFDKDSIPITESDEQAKTVKVIDHVLLVHRGPIWHFKLSTNLRNCEDIDRWIDFVSTNDIKELTIEKWEGQNYQVPLCLFFCRNLSYLELYGCTITLPDYFNGFNVLTALDLQSVTLSNEGLELLISLCPLLTKLVLYDLAGCSRIRIRAPKLVHLSIDGEFEHLSFEETPLLAMVYIVLNIGKHHVFSSEAASQLVEFFCSLPSIERLELYDDAPQILTVGEVPRWLPTTSKLKYLSMDINFEDEQGMLAFLCICHGSPSLEEIDIMAVSSKKGDDFSVEDLCGVLEDFTSFFRPLQNMEITEFTGRESEIGFIEFVLANAPNLETVKIELSEDVDVLRVLKKIIRFRRLSAKAVILFPTL